ncbi:MAG TPA: hypothetical protein VNG51_06840 [Ktedonobacteraceae bacterium]|nr:hypothetical protein [Ktedonobacteraceae bacterium]
MSTKKSGCWQLLWTLLLCIFFVIGVAALNQLNLLVTCVNYGIEIFTFSAAAWYFYTGFKGLYRIRKQKESKPWENDIYVVRELSRPLSISKSLMVDYHLMEAPSSEPEHNRVLKLEKRPLSEWQKNLIEGFGYLGAGIMWVQQFSDDIHKLTAPDPFSRILLCICLVTILWIFVNIPDVLIRQVMKKGGSMPESPQSISENTDLPYET